MSTLQKNTLQDYRDFCIGILSLLASKQDISISLDALRKALEDLSIQQRGKLPISFDGSVSVDKIVSSFDGKAQPLLSYGDSTWKVLVGRSQATAALLKLRETRGQKYLEQLRPLAALLAPLLNLETANRS